MPLAFFSRNDPKAAHKWPYIYFHNAAEALIDTEWNTKLTEAVKDAYISQNDRDDLWCAPDLVGSSTALQDVPDGLHEAAVYGRPAMLYLWTDPKLADYIVPAEEADTSHILVPGEGAAGAIHTRQGVIRRGLIVLADDTEAKAYAQTKFESKEWML